MAILLIPVLFQAAWFLKGRALTEQTYVDEVEMEEEGIAELFMEDTAIADVASKSTMPRRPLTTITICLLVYVLLKGLALRFESHLELPAMVLVRVFDLCRSQVDRCLALSALALKVPDLRLWSKPS